MKKIGLYYSFTSVKSSIFLLIFFIFTKAQSQVIPEEPQDTIKGFNTGNIKISDPNSILEAYTYDPITDRYIYTKTFEGFNINYPIVLTPKQYQELISIETIR